LALFPELVSVEFILIPSKIAKLQWDLPRIQ
jgi:hypothetical protein